MKRIRSAAPVLAFCLAAALVACAKKEPPPPPPTPVPTVAPTPVPFKVTTVDLGTSIGDDKKVKEARPRSARRTRSTPPSPRRAPSRR